MTYGVTHLEREALFLACDVVQTNLWYKSTKNLQKNKSNACVTTHVCNCRCGWCAGKVVLTGF